MKQISPVNNTPPVWGAYLGWLPQDLTTFETKINQKMQLLGVFVHWGNNNQFPVEMANLAKSRGQTLVIYWEAMDYNSPDPVKDLRFSYDQILKGDWDQYLTYFAKASADYGAPVILIPFEEMNGDWYSWSLTKNGNSPQKHIAAFRYIHNFFKDTPNVKFAWVINNETLPENPKLTLNQYYPGSIYVDYVGVDGFNFGDPWVTFNQIFDKPLTDLEKLGKPIMIFSMACAPGPQKAVWISDALKQISARSSIRGFIWFNENKEKDWRLWSDQNSLKAFQKGITNL